MKVLGIIPARAGSTRLQRKHMRLLGGRRLFDWTLRAARSCLDLTAGVMVTSDDDDVLMVARGAGLIAHRRPDNLCGPDTASIDVVRHYEDLYQDCDAVALLQPTSPFRTAGDISRAIQMMSQYKADAVVSVTDATLESVFEVGTLGRMRQVENRSGLYMPNGGIYLLSREAIEQNHDWWTVTVAYAYRMPKSRSIDIDTMADLQQAEALLAQDAVEWGEDE